MPAAYLDIFRCKSINFNNVNNKITTNRISTTTYWIGLNWIELILFVCMRSDIMYWFECIEKVEKVIVIVMMLMLIYQNEWLFFYLSHRWYTLYQNYLLASGKRIALVMQATLFLVSSSWWYNIFICNEWVNAFRLLYFYILYFACYYWFAKSCLLCFFFARYAY